MVVLNHACKYYYLFYYAINLFDGFTMQLCGIYLMKVEVNTTVAL